MTAPARAGSRDPASGSYQALRARARSNLRSFTSWLAGARARGLIGEISWPGNPAAGGDARWNSLASDWYAQAAAAKLWVTAWAASELWRGGQRLALFDARRGSLDTELPQGAVVAAQAAYPQLRGVTVAGGDFGGAPDEQPTSAFSNANPGTYGRDYSYPGAASWRYLAGRGIQLARLPFRWERIQRQPGAPLNPAELARLRRSLADAGAAKLQVILDLHNYGAYYAIAPKRRAAGARPGLRLTVGSSQLPSAAFADVWRRLALALRGDRAVAGYGLMNEPVGVRGGARTWERASRAAVAAIRATRDLRPIFVASYYWGGVTGFAQFHPRGPWISDPNLFYEGHQYFDDDNSGRYALSYDKEAQAARAEGFAPAAPRAARRRRSNGPGH